MAGNTARIDRVSFTAEWCSHIPIRSICERHTITKDQLIRLKHIWDLAPRHDRRLRVKPPRALPPSDEEVAASEASLSLAPAIAAAVTVFHATWTPSQWAERRCVKPTPVILAALDVENWMPPGFEE